MWKFRDEICLLERCAAGVEQKDTGHGMLTMQLIRRVKDGAEKLQKLEGDGTLVYNKGALRDITHSLVMATKECQRLISHHFKTEQSVELCDTITPKISTRVLKREKGHIINLLHELSQNKWLSSEEKDKRLNKLLCVYNLSPPQKNSLREGGGKPTGLRVIDSVISFLESV